MSSGKKDEPSLYNILTEGLGNSPRVIVKAYPFGKDE